MGKQRVCASVYAVYMQSIYMACGSKETEVKPFGTTFYVYAEVHKELPEVQFIVDTGAGVSLLPQKVFEQIPLEDRPQLTPAERHVYCGNEQGIRLAGIAYMKIH